MTNRRILVTGASGFVGRAVVQALLEHEAAREVHSVSRGPLELGTRHHVADLLQPGSVRSLVHDVQPQLVVHAAWYAVHGAFWNAPENLDWVGATMELARALAEQGGARLVGVGSCAEYAWDDAPGAEGLHEQRSPCAPDTLYGTAKDATRRLLESFAATAELDWAWGRLFMPYGPGEASTRLLPSLALPLLRGESARASAGTQERDFLHVSDVGRALAQLALGGLVGAVNVASGEGRSVADFARAVAQACGAPERLELGALPMRPGDAPRVVADTTRLRSLGFRPAFDLEAGVAQAVDALRRAP